VVIGNCPNVDCTPGPSEGGFYGSGTPSAPIQIVHGAAAGWGTGDVTIDCAGMTILSPWDWGCVHVSDWWDDGSPGNWTWVRGAGPANRIRVVNSANHGIFTFDNDQYGLEGLAFEYVEAAYNKKMGIDVSFARRATIKDVYAHDNGSSGIAMGHGNGWGGVLAGTVVDSRAERNGLDASSGNRNGFNFFDCGSVTEPCVNVRGVAARNGRDGSDNGLLGTTRGAFALYVDLESYDNGEDGFACNGDERMIGSFTCSLVGGRLFNNTNDGTCVYEDGTTQYVTNTVLQRNGSYSNGSAGAFGVVKNGDNVRFVGRNNVVYRPNEGLRVFQHCGSSAGSGTPVREVSSSVFVPRFGDTDAFAPNGSNFDTAPGTGYFSVFAGNRLGVSAPNFDSPALFSAVSDSVYSGNDYRPSAATAATVDAGTPYCTVTSASGTGTTFAVSCDPRVYFFAAGLRPLVPADVAYIGSGSPCTIAALTATSITCTAPVSWAGGASVSRVPVYGAGPDAGPVEWRP
jgi:hypothetical protein